MGSGLLFSLLVVAAANVLPVTAVQPVVLSPIKTATTEAALIIVPGAEISGTAYRPLAEVIQHVSSLKLWVVLLDGFVLNDPNPVQIPGAVSAARQALQQHGMTSDNVFLAGHSLGGVFVGPYGQKHADELKGVVLFASYLTRDVRLATYPLPVLHISGDLDGQTRITRIADTFEEFQKALADGSTDKYRTPVIILSGVNHAQFASGTMPPAVREKDLQPEASSQEAYQLIAKHTAAFLVTSLNPSSAEVLSAKATLDAAFQQTQQIMTPLLTVKQFDVNDANMDLLAVLAEYKEAGLPSTVFKVDNTILSLEAFILSKPKVVSSRSAQGCHLQPYPVIGTPQQTVSGVSVDSNTCIVATTYTHLSYQLNPMDISTHMSSPEEVAIKLKSKEYIQSNTHVQGLSGDPSCRDFNQIAIDQAMKYASAVATQRYQSRGRKIFLNEDVNHSTGLAWTTDSIKYNEDDSGLHVTSPGLKSGLDAGPVFSGMHYCKLMSPYRVMEWMYVDSLRSAAALP